MVGLMVNSKRVYAKGAFQCPCPCGEPLPTHTSTGGPPTLAGGFDSVSLGSLLLSSGSWCKQNFVCALQDWSLFPPVLWKSYNQIPLALEFKFPGDSQSHGQISGMGSLMWDSEASQQCENLFGIIVLQSVSSPTWGCGIWFYCECTPPTDSLWLLLCLWTWGILFWGFQHPPVDGCSTVSHNFGAFTGEDVHMSFHSTILNQTR